MDKHRASGIKPAMKLKFQPKFTIFESPIGEIYKKSKSRNHRYKKFLNYDSFKYYKKRFKCKKAKEEESPPDSLKTNDGSNSVDPDSQEIEACERHLYDRKDVEEYIPKRRENFNTADKMNQLRQRKPSPPNCWDPHHNEEVYEYESQAAKEAIEFNSPPHKKIKTKHFENSSPKKKPKSTKLLLSRLTKRRPKICRICTIKNKDFVRRKPKAKSHTRNVVHKVHDGNPKLYQRVAKIKLNDEFYCDFEDKLLEKEHQLMEIPFTPRGSPVNRLRHLLRKDCYHGNEYIDKRVRLNPHNLVNAIWVDNIKGHNFNNVLYSL